MSKDLNCENYYFMGLEPYSVLGRTIKDHQFMSLIRGLEL